MLQINADDFSLTYDFVTDTGKLWYEKGEQHLLTARVERGAWTPQNSAAWFEFEYSNDRYTKGHGPRTPKLQTALYRLRALVGLSNDPMARLERMTALLEIQKWDTLMKHGIWRCHDPNCKLRCQQAKPRALRAA